MQVDGAHSQVFVQTNIAILERNTCCISVQKCLLYEFMIEQPGMAKESIFHYFLVLSQISCHFGACEVIKTYVLCLSSSEQSRPLTINHSVNTHEQVAGSQLPTKSLNPTAEEGREHVCILHRQVS